MTGITVRQTLMTKWTIAVRTVFGTSRAKCDFTVVTACLLGGCDYIGALGTFNAVPVTERHIGTVGVISSQQTGHHREKIKQPSLFQRPAYDLPSISLTDDI